MSQRRILVTAALPYANGHIHIGHLVEYLQTDIWVRFQRLRGHDCRFFCADDTHGTGIMIRARAEGRTERDLVAEMSVAHQRDFAAFDIAFDHYGSTDSEANRELCAEIWRGVRELDLIREATVERFFDPAAGTFLADRFVKGICPKCAAPDQYGDSCDKCGATYAATDLSDPRSALSGAVPELRASRQLFVQVEQLHDFLADWVVSGALQPETARYLQGNFLAEPLRDWDVSRPAPYFGFEIPDEPGNYWYVWFDAPIGYLASCRDWCAKTGNDFTTWWPRERGERNPEPTEIHHFIGRDIVYFHTLFWPAMLHAGRFRLPDRVHVHGFLTVNGEKMSKSKGTFINASTWAEHLDPSALRYYYATRLNGRDEDLDLSLEDFKAKVDSDLVNKVVNLASRSAKFVTASGLAETWPADDGLFATAAAEGETIAAAYEAGDYAQATRRIMALADRANEYVERTQPWKLRQDPNQAATLQAVCTVALNLFRQLVVYLAPVLPGLAREVGELLGEEISDWNQAATPLLGRPIGTYRHLMKRVDPKALTQVVEASRDAAAEIAATSADVVPVDDGAALAGEPLAETCTFEDFLRVDLRIARVVAAEPVTGSNKLLHLQLSLGGEERRTVFAGIQAAYAPADLIGRLVVFVANLAPRKMRFGTSEGMVVAAGPGGQEVFLLAPDSGAVPGQRVH